ncbi:MAG: 1,4-alpha-glucan branching protein GlgB [Pseudomonadota bacterium]|nr:1,4-alpha-glucan branching protein GlgB [Pseudomonadota bacterium]
MNERGHINSGKDTVGFDPEQADALLRGQHSDPFSLLGPHPDGDGWIVRAFLPGATAASLISANTGDVAMAPYQDQGLFWVRLPEKPSRYNIQASNGGGEWSVRDPYQYGPVLGEMDEYLLAEGTHGRLWEVLGAHLREHEGDTGAVFAVWAPNARRVSVVGDFNDWDGRRYPMRLRGSTGVWEIFLPGLSAGARYKYEIAGANGGLPFTKADPVARQAEMRPDNCSVLPAQWSDDWQDDDWMATRAERQRLDSAISIYEVHMGSWKRSPDGRWLNYRELADTLIPYVVDMGFTHIEMLPITEHPFDGSWGYQTTGLYAPTSRYGTPEDFRAFVEACHAAGIGLILDWVPAHFPVDPHGLAKFDGTELYEHQDRREGYHPDWNTLIYNLSRREVVNYLMDNAFYWLEQFHLDALRVDAVASMLYRDYSRNAGEWIPNKYGGRENLESIDFLQRMNTTVYGADPTVMTMAEESTAWPGVSRPVHEGGLGFGFKWNMGWMHDTLTFMQTDPLFRRVHHAKMSFGMEYAFSENFVLPLSHDEVVHGKGSLWGKMPGDTPQKLANLKAYYAFMWAHPGKKLLFMGQEFGQHGEWSEQNQLEWGLLETPEHEGLRCLVRDLNQHYRQLPALHQHDCRPEGFQWIDGAAADAGVFAWVRYGEPDTKPLLAVFNFAGVPHEGWRLGVPKAGRWRQLLNTEATAYGGAGAADNTVIKSEPEPFHGQEQSIVVDMPALSATWYLWEAE